MIKIMLTKVVRQNSSCALDAAKQLLIWGFSKKQEFHISCIYSFNNRNDTWENINFKRSRRFEFTDDLQKVDFNLDELKPFKKNFYEPHPNVVNRSEEEIKEFHKKYDIQIFGRSKNLCPAPIFSFEELDLPASAVDLIRNLNYTNPTPVQSQTWPLALSGFNMVGISQTGSGKTLGFMLPALLHVQSQPPVERGDGPVALVIAPTRELTQQIFSVVKPFARSIGLRAACIYGGSSKNLQREKLERTHFCIATPGRLIDFLREGTISLNRCTYCVLDEADRLLDMGFEPQIRSVMSQIRPDSQMTMWSATWPTEVRDLAETFLKDYIGIKFGSTELMANPKIKQHINMCRENEKRSLLLELLEKIEKEEYNKTLIFTKTKTTAEYVCQTLRKNGIRARFIHGDLSQRSRENILQDFRSGYINNLVGTSVISRGLDISDIRFVILFDFPTDTEEYVHVIGRTARDGNPGSSFTFFTSEDFPHARNLIRILEGANQEVPDFLREAPTSKGRGFGSRFHGRERFRY